MITAHPLAAQAGLSVYRKGGNVVDAAVATAYALGVVEPHGSGIGGEGMMLIYDARSRSTTVVDFKGISPAAASYRNCDFQNTRSWSRTIRGASIPGAVAGLELAREKFGKMSRAVDLQPAIDYAEKGFEIDSALAANLAAARDILLKDPSLAKLYYKDGNALPAGTIVVNKEYGKSLALIAQKGPDEFYRGSIAAAIVRDCRKNGGFMTTEDFAAYAPVIRTPLTGEYRGYRIVTTPPPCGGMLLLETLNILKYADLKEANARDQYSLHILGEVFPMIYKDEATHNADPAFFDVPVARVTSDEYAFERFKSISLSHAGNPTSVTAGVAEEKHTTHLNVMDGEGNAVALTITLSSMFGTAHMIPGTGIVLNNEMQNFNQDSTAANALRPHKRVVTSLVPTIVFHGDKPVLVTGAPGGDLIISSVAQVLVNTIDYRMPLPVAVAAPRIFTTFYQKEMELENRFPETSLRQLEGLGWSLKKYGPFRAYFAVVHSIQYDPATRTLLGVADPRRSGAAIGE